jgi:hypothetical protein
LELLLPGYPEIGREINYNEELNTVESGCHRMKDEILETHNKLEEDFNAYGDDEEDASSINDEEGEFKTDISRLLKSNFFKNK